MVKPCLQDFINMLHHDFPSFLLGKVQLLRIDARNLSAGLAGLEASSLPPVSALGEQASAATALRKWFRVQIRGEELCRWFW